MEKDRILGVLQEHAAELNAAGIKRLRLYGSVARGEATSRSDVDLLAEFDRTKPITLVTLGSLEHRLGVLLGVKVDLSTEDWMKDPAREHALREAVIAF